MTDSLDEIIQKTRDWFKEHAKRFAFKKLEREIIKTEICVECGTCVSVCPVQAITGEWHDEKYVPTLTGECVSCGLCYAFCPRTFSLREELIGNSIRILKVRTTLNDLKRQNGGAVTTFLRLLLQQGLIDAAIVAVAGSKAWKPIPKIVTSPDELQGRTFYTHVPMTISLMEAIDQGHQKIAVVGTSCNMDAFEKMLSGPSGILSRNSNIEILRLGLFCMDSFNYSRLDDFLKENNIEMKQVKRFEISKGKFRVEVDNETVEWPIADLHHLMNKSCDYCFDLTCMNSDVSFGNIGSDEKWTTVIVRSQRGANLFEQLIRSNMVEHEELEQKTVFIIEKIARLKMKRKYSN